MEELSNRNIFGYLLNIQWRCWNVVIVIHRRYCLWFTDAEFLPPTVCS